MVCLLVIAEFGTAGTDVEQGDIDNSKFDKFFSSLLEMEDVKKKFKDDLDNKIKPKGKANVVADENQTSKVDPKGKTNVGDENQFVFS
ncbi:hypothetical protein Hanom_Chr04g00309421 [Helianthus anomalus]